MKITAHLNGNTTVLLYERWTDDVPTHVEGEPNVLCYKLPTKLSSRVIFEFLRPVLDTIGRPLNKVTNWNCFSFKNQVHSLVYACCVLVCMLFLFDVSLLPLTSNFNLSWPFSWIYISFIFLNLTPHLCKRTKYIGHGMCVIVGMNLKYYAGLKIWQKPGVYVCNDYSTLYIWREIYLLSWFSPPALTSCCIWDSLTLNRFFFPSVDLEDWKQSIIVCVNPEWQYI